MAIRKIQKKKLYSFLTTNRVVCLYRASVGSTFEINYGYLNLKF